ncbi:hypothetical protein Cni_G09325 [Canna indica]|uniref:Glycosyl transferase family 1 domain-containing protein n=1 Tax=Canna indica TaxID=4628 RepID=A0AAQ3K2F3_9LILI|nr:hypothetical protein Cni_G09325 [Canna indica]
MNTSVNNTNTSTQSPHTIPKRLKWRPSMFCAAAVFALSLALVLNIKNPLTLKPNFILNLRRLILIARRQPQTEYISGRPPCVLWMAPFLSPGGYSSEAWSYITALHDHAGDRFKLQIDHHGDLQSIEFWLGLPEESQRLAYDLHGTQCSSKETIVVCHSEPGAWYPPLFETSPCPPDGYEDPVFVVGRTMFETDRLNPEHVARCNRMDAVWVPTEFHVSSFLRSGVDPAKVIKVVQPVDVEFFDPAKHEPLALPLGSPVLGSNSSNLGRHEFVFLSVFKWEHRKGWDVLLKAYLEEFSKADGVALYLLTNAYHSDNDFASEIKVFVEMSKLKEPSDGWAPIYLLDAHIPQSDLPRIYKAADAFVLPSRGEGWGRPIVEAMAMAMPVITTNWSGPTEYLTEENAYPLPVDRMSELKEGPFRGHLRAEPSAEQLKVLMRHVVNNPEEGRRKGRKARSDMIERFSPQIVARIVVDHIMNIVNNSSERTR